MIRLISILLVAVGLGTGAWIAVNAWHASHVVESRPSDWLVAEFGMDSASSARAKALHSEFEVRCVAMCERIQQADDRLRSALKTSTGMTPELRAALQETDDARTDCRSSMLEYFYAVAALLPPDQRARYLEIVLPVAMHPEEMAVRSVRP